MCGFALLCGASSGIARAGYAPNIRASHGWHADITFEPFPSDYAVCSMSIMWQAHLLIAIFAQILKMHTLPEGMWLVDPSLLVSR